MPHKCEGRAVCPARPEKLVAVNRQADSAHKIRPYCAFCNLFGGAIHGDRPHAALSPVY